MIILLLLQMSLMMVQVSSASIRSLDTNPSTICDSCTALKVIVIIESTILSLLLIAIIYYFCVRPRLSTRISSIHLPYFGSIFKRKTTIVPVNTIAADQQVTTTTNR